MFDTTAGRRYTRLVARVIEFGWDQWNVQKNEVKHGVSRLEAESAFHDPHYRLFRDLIHSMHREARYLFYGWSLENRILTVGFTLRGARIRVITARPASRKERRIYEED
ncbi:MAG: BrnT family toxin [Acidobacteriota bacterium]